VESCTVMRVTPARNDGGSADAVDIKAAVNARPRMSERKRFSFCRMLLRSS
jgi:hypothetical protein